MLLASIVHECCVKLFAYSFSGEIQVECDTSAGGPLSWLRHVRLVTIHLPHLSELKHPAMILSDIFSVIWTSDTTLDHPMLACNVVILFPRKQCLHTTPHNTGTIAGYLFIYLNIICR